MPAARGVRLSIVRLTESTRIIPQTCDLEGWLLLGGLQPVELAAGMLIVGLTTSATVPLAWLLESPVFVWLGRRPYAIYLWHLPLAIWARAVMPASPFTASIVGLPCTLIAAELSFRYLEWPVLRLRDLMSRRARHRRPALAMAA